MERGPRLDDGAERRRGGAIRRGVPLSGSGNPSVPLGWPLEEWRGLVRGLVLTHCPLRLPVTFDPARPSVASALWLVFYAVFYRRYVARVLATAAPGESWRSRDDG